MADDLIFKARDKLTGAEGKLEAFRFAALESFSPSQKPSKSMTAVSPVSAPLLSTSTILEFLS